MTSMSVQSIFLFRVLVIFFFFFGNEPSQKSHSSVNQNTKAVGTKKKCDFFIWHAVCRKKREKSFIQKTTTILTLER